MTRRENTRYNCKVCGNRIPINIGRNLFCSNQCEFIYHKKIKEDRIPEERIPDYVSSLFKNEIPINAETVIGDKHVCP